MISKEEHHRFMESLRQSLPHHSSADSVKSLREPPPCNNAEDDAEFDKILAEILEAFSDSGLDGQCTAATSTDV